MKKTILSFAILVAVTGISPAHSQDVVPVSEAFKVSHIVNSDKFLINISVADGYQLYRNTIGLSDNVSATLEGLPLGEPAVDEFMGDVRYLDGSFQVTGKINSVEGDRFYFEYQGCNPGVFCYPPQRHEIITP